jgi:hypothetical protein
VVGFENVRLWHSRPSRHPSNKLQKESCTQAPFRDDDDAVAWYVTWLPTPQVRAAAWLEEYRLFYAPRALIGLCNPMVTGNSLCFRTRLVNYPVARSRPREHVRRRPQAAG